MVRLVLDYAYVLSLGVKFKSFFSRVKFMLSSSDWLVLGEIVFGLSI